MITNEEFKRRMQILREEIEEQDRKKRMKDFEEEEELRSRRQREEDEDSTNQATQDAANQSAIMAACITATM